MAATPFVVDSILTAIAVGYRNPERSYIADIICPRARVSEQAFRYTRYPLAEAYTVPDTRVGRLGEPNSIAVTGTEDTGATEDYALQGPIPQRDLDIDGGRHNIRGRTTERLTDLLLLDREQRVAKFYSDPANYDSSLTLTLSGSSRFSDPTSDPLQVLLDALDQPLLRPNTMALGQIVWSALRRHPRLVKAMGSTTGEGAITEQQLAEKLRISRLVVGESRVNTARPGQAAALERVWQSNISLTYIDPLADFTSGGVTFALTAQWQDRFAGEYALPGVGLRGATVIKAGESVVEVAIAPHAGYLIRNAV